jgi:hypothetical protein
LDIPLDILMQEHLSNSSARQQPTHQRTRREWIPRREKHQPFRFGFKFKFNVIKFVRLEEIQTFVFYKNKCKSPLMGHSCTDPEHRLRSEDVNEYLL